MVLSATTRPLRQRISLPVVTVEIRVLLLMCGAYNYVKKLIV